MKEKKLLIVDDEPDLRDALKEFLQDEFTVLIAENGEEALDIALAEHPDLILMDVMMPKMTGHEVLEKLRENDWGQDAKVIFLTSMSDMENISKGVEQQNVGYLVKSSTSLSDIIETVKKNLK